MHVFIRVRLYTLIYICICVHGMIGYCDVPVYVHACRVVVVYTGVLHCWACIYHIVAVYITMRIVHYISVFHVQCASYINTNIICVYFLSYYSIFYIVDIFHIILYYIILHQIIIYCIVLYYYIYIK